ncbi:MAG: CinA family nicotinamide mononucleotide deamidase-related protein [Spirochaetes bacterium]|nr:CinA family nicotinamide mononucleotide deamidase-related protein [Spirochaetota bacterium]
MRAALVATGSELLHGSVRDTNAAFIGSRLFRTDLELAETRFTGDREDDIRRAIEETADRYDVVFVTGGLGPTEDDITCAAICAVSGLGTEIHAPSKERMMRFFAARGVSPNAGDMKMVTVPAGAAAFPNEVGLACGFAVRRKESTILALPGVPREMERMFDAHVLPYLMKELGARERCHLVFRVAAVREAEVDRRVKSLALPLGELEWGICTSPGVNEVTFAEKKGRPFAEGDIAAAMKGEFGDALLERGSLEEDVVFLLEGRGLTLALAESCTGGMVAARVTDVPGASRVFTGGVTAYANEVKAGLLGVSVATLEKFGAVSEETAREMAEGARQIMRAGIGVSVTGIAGPGGGSVEKPVGTVCFGLASPKGVVSRKEFFPGDRARVRDFSAAFALNMLRTYLAKK